MGLVAHVDAGKTTLTESILYNSGVIRSMGRVDDKNAYLDTDSQEKDRGITIYSKQAVMQLDDLQITMVDTPGHIDFGAEMERALGVLDIAVLVVSGIDGVQAHSKTVWKLLNRLRLPVIVFVNKMDISAKSREELLENIRHELDDSIAEITDIDTIATCSEELLGEYLENDSISEDSIYNAVVKGEFHPCLFGSALKSDGVEALLDTVKKVAAAKDFCSGAYACESNDNKSTFGAYCYKISRDDAGVRLSHLKICDGILRIKDYIGDEKVNEIRMYSGRKYSAIKEAVKGDMVAIPGLVNTVPGMGIGTKVGSGRMNLEPVLSYAIRHDGSLTDNQLLQCLKEVEEELPELRVEYDEEHRETRVSLMGEVQREILTQVMADRYSVAVTFDVGSISYKETISDVVEGVGHFEPLRHYAEVHLKMEPADIGTGISIDTNVSEDVLDKNWIRLIMTHLSERVHRGVLTGSPLTDVKITVVGGRAHTKHTEGGDFRQATYRAVRQGLMQAHSRLLEPYYEYTLELPEQYIGKAMSDIDRMNGTCTLSENVGGVGVLIGRAPVATMHTYGSEVMAYSGGRGHLYLNSGGYAACHNEEEVIERIGYNPDADKRNLSSSVFCEHGAGVIVPWDEVFDKMHVPPCINGLKRGDDIAGFKPLTAPRQSEAISIGTDEIDEIINRTAYANRKSVSAHKGISAAVAAKNRQTKTYIPPKEIEYKGTVTKQKYLLVDGYNVIFAWEELKELAHDNIDGARGRLLDILDHYRSMIDDEIIVVFDAYRLQNHKTEYLDYNTIHVVYTKTAENADQYIERFSHEHGKKYDITVVTSDGLEQIIIRGQGCRLISSREFEDYVLGASEKMCKEHGL